MLLSAVALAAPTPTPDGATVLDPCLGDPTCDATWRPLLSETLLESGWEMVHEPIQTSALGGKGGGLVAAVELGSAPLGPRNELQTLFPSVPALPTVAAGWHLGSYTYETAYPQVAVGVHGLVPVRFGPTTLWSAGGTASAALPLSPVWWVGAEATYTAASLRVPLSAEVDQLQTVSSFLTASPLCAAPCTDRFLQHAGSLRVGGSVEPLPAAFGWFKLGVTALRQELDLAVDGSRWAWTPVLPEVSVGAGLRAGDRFQLAAGGLAAQAPPGSSSGGPWIGRVVVSSGFRFGDARYHEP